MVCMKQVFKYIWWTLALVVLLAPACSKADFEMGPDASYFDKGAKEGVAIGTVRSQDGVRYIRLDGVSRSQVMNPNVIKDIPDGTRVYLEFRYVVDASVASFCSDAILVEWASALDVGAVAAEPYENAIKPSGNDPVDILVDWMTSLEDGFLTLHYSIPSSGNVKHDFFLYPGKSKEEWQLVHDAHGDTKGALIDGIICFDVAGLLPDAMEGTVKLSLDYFDLNNTNKRLTVEYQSPK